MTATPLHIPNEMPYTVHSDHHGVILYVGFHPVSWARYWEHHNPDKPNPALIDIAVPVAHGFTEDLSYASPAKSVGPLAPSSVWNFLAFPEVDANDAVSQLGALRINHHIQEWAGGAHTNSDGGIHRRHLMSFELSARDLANAVTTSGDGLALQLTPMTVQAALIVPTRANTGPLRVLGDLLNLFSSTLVSIAGKRGPQNPPSGS